MTSSLILELRGMSCASCADSIRDALKKVPGVSEADVNFMTSRALVRFEDGRVSKAVLEQAVRAAGYEVWHPERPEPRPWYLNPWLGVAVIGLLLFGGWALDLARVISKEAANVILLIGTALASIPVFKAALVGLRNRELNAELLVSFAVVAAVAIGEFFAAGEVAFIMFLGEHLEAYTIHRARSSIGELLGKAPKTARVLRGAVETEVPIQEVLAGDIAIVRPGEQIPVDGDIVKGQGSINEAMITGESLPVDKEMGAEVYAGTLNLNGALQVKATRVGRDSTLEQIAALMEEAKGKQAPIQRACDRYARFVIPLMLLLSGLTFLFTRDFYRAIVVMIVACPCALVVATPTAVVAGIARAAREGVLIKGGAYLEMLGRVNAVVFDKTGTLTEGKIEVAKVDPAEGISFEALLRAAASAEKFSEHPLGEAVVRHARKAGLELAEPEAFRAQPGSGVSALVDGAQVYVGKREFLKAEGVDVAAAPFHRETGTELWVSRAGKVIGRIRVSDVVREQAAHTIRDLRSIGMSRLVLLSGDRREPSERLAREIGITDVIPEVLPAQKSAEIARLKQEGLLVAMVGEGVNDAPALATADVGIAMGLSGSDVAHEAAQIALMSDDLSKIGFAVKLSRNALGIIKQGLGFAVVFNLVMISSAMGNQLDHLAHAIIPIGEGRLGMVLAAIAHQSSSILVILNSMRVLAFRDRI